MSCSYGLFCETCGVKSPTWWNHGELQVRECVKVWPSVKLIRASTTLVECKPELAAWDEPFIFEFLAAHDGHTLAVIDEYDRKSPINQVTPMVVAWQQLYPQLWDERQDPDSPLGRAIEAMHAAVRGEPHQQMEARKPPQTTTCGQCLTDCTFVGWLCRCGRTAIVTHQPPLLRR